MFVGHAGVALAAKSRTPTVSLGWLLAAAFGLDLIWPVLVLARVERVTIVPGAMAFNALVFESYPWSHSLLLSVVWGTVAAGMATALGQPRKGALILGTLVVSHWLLDFVTHAPDLPLSPGLSTRVGLGLWNSAAATIAVEGSLYVAGIVLYLRSTRRNSRTGSLALWVLLVSLAAIWLSSPWAPPPNVTALATTALGLWLFILWAAWADRHRERLPDRWQVYGGVDAGDHDRRGYR